MSGAFDVANVDHANSALPPSAIIQLENGIADVDVPCSGVKSLWAGCLLFFAATWLLGRRLGLAWILVGLVNLSLLFAAIVLRVFLLVLLGFIADAPEMAHLCHVPLGVLGFVGSSAACLYLLLRLPADSNPADVTLASRRDHSASGLGSPCARRRMTEESR